MLPKPRLPLSRIVLTALLFAALTVPGAQAAPVSHPGAAGSLSLLGLLTRAWSSLVSLWPDNGCSADPNGGCKAAPALDNGCILDPNGGCKAAPALDNGCIADPNGGCHSGS